MSEFAWQPSGDLFRVLKKGSRQVTALQEVACLGPGTWRALEGVDNPGGALQPEMVQSGLRVFSHLGII
jgi:hypothetical protein